MAVSSLDYLDSGSDTCLLIKIKCILYCYSELGIYYIGRGI